MKQREFTKCVGCGKGMGGGPNIHFYRVKIEQFILDIGAIQRQHGLEQMLGGGQAGGAIAAVMGPDADLAKGLGEATMLVCGECGLMQTYAVGELLERGAEKEEAVAEKAKS